LRDTFSELDINFEEINKSKLRVGKRKHKVTDICVRRYGLQVYSGAKSVKVSKQGSLLKGKFLGVTYTLLPEGSSRIVKAAFSDSEQKINEYMWHKDMIMEQMFENQDSSDSFRINPDDYEDGDRTFVI